MQQKSRQINKHLASPPSKIRKTIIKIDKRGIEINGQKEKKTDEDLQGLTSERWHRLRVKKEEWRRLTRNEDFIETSI